jgi:hypothetical protein
MIVDLTKWNLIRLCDQEARRILLAHSAIPMRQALAAFTI